MEINLTKLTPDVRKLADIKSVLLYPEALEKLGNIDLYYMYRGIKVENGIKQNITVFPPNMIGQEFMKTLGHVHMGSFSEIYKVLEGQAIFLMQKTKGNAVEDVYAVKAEKGDCVIIPPYYGHVTINPSQQELKTQDWTSVDCKSDYKMFEDLHGACYYFTKSGWVKNEKYQNIPEIRFEEPLKTFPENLDFLKEGALG